MFETFDNNGFIRVNYHSNPEVAESITKHARKLEVPVASSLSTMGGYCFPVLEDIAQGREFQILKCGLPGDSSANQIAVDNILHDQNTVYAYVDAGNITTVQVDGWFRKDESLADHGWSILANQKTFKRLKTLNRPFRTYAVFNNRPLRVHIVGNDDYTDIDTSPYDDEMLERLLDGAFVIAPWMRDSCMQNVSFPLGREENGGETNHYDVDDFRRKMFVRQACHVEAWNARIFGPMHFSGAISGDDELHIRPGMLKGEAFVHTSDICELMKVDVICARTALKGEVNCSSKTFILMEAQSPKFEGIMSDLQTKVNLPALYRIEDVKSSTEQVVMKAFKGLTDNKLLDYWYEMTSPLFGRDTAMYDMQDVSTLTKWNARAWVMSGLQVTMSPWLFEQLARSIISALRPNDMTKLRFPIIGAIRCQIISASYASMCGMDIEIEPGQGRFIPELESVIVHDDDWIEMYPSHGGCDLDDFFVCYYRTLDDRKVIVAVRSPNDYGEYSILDYVEGDFAPQFETHEGQVIAFPVIPNDPDLWPQRLSEAVAEGKIHYDGLPSENAPKDDTPPEEYSLKHVQHGIINNKSSQACVGANVNARSLWSLTARQHRSQQLTTMESCIDAGAQGGSAQDTEAVMAEAKEIVDKVIKETDGPIDAYLWTSRFAQIHKYPFEMSRMNPDGYITQADYFRRSFIKHFTVIAKDWAQRNCINNFDPMIHKLGAVRQHDAYQLLISTRAATVYSQRSKTNTMGDLNQSLWSDIHAPVKAALDSQPTEFDRHNLVIALLSVCHKAPTSTTGRYSDQLVMNPEVFPYLLDALRAYGIAAHLEIQNDKITRVWKTSWELTCSECGTSVVTKSPTALQSYHYYEGLCKGCRTDDEIQTHSISTSASAT